MTGAELRRFCSTDEGRASLREPWNDNLGGVGCVVVCNGAILVADFSCEPVVRDAILNEGPSLENLLRSWKWELLKDLRPFPPHRELREGVGLNRPRMATDATEVDCDKCGGSGICICRACEDQHDCWRCMGIGRLWKFKEPSPFLYGRGQVDGGLYLTAAGLPDARMGTLPGGRILPFTYDVGLGGIWVEEMR